MSASKRKVAKIAHDFLSIKIMFNPLVGTVLNKYKEMTATGDL